LTADGLAGALRESAAGLRSVRIRGTGEVREAGAAAARRFLAQIAAEAPSRIRAQASLGSFTPLFTLVVCEEGMGLHLPLRREVLVSGPRERIVWEGRAMSFSPEEVLPVFLPGRFADRIPGTAAVTRAGGDYLLEWGGASGTESLWISGATGSVTRYTGIAPDGEGIEIAYSEHALRDRVWYPGRIRVSVPGAGIAVTLNVERLEANPQLSPDLFARRYPAGVAIRHLGSVGGP
jgi:hypothetical protein